MELFELDENMLPIVTAKALLIPAFKKIVTKDKDRNKELAKKELAFLYLYCNYNSDFVGLPDNERLDVCKTELRLPDNWSIDKYVQDAIDEYIKHTELNKPFIKFLKSCYTGLEKIRKYIEEIDLSELDSNGKPVYSAKDLVTNIGKASELISAISELEEKVKKQALSTSKVRGGEQIGVFEEVDN